MKKLYLLLMLVLAWCHAHAQSQVVTTGNNVVDATNPHAADIVIGSNSGTRHAARIMWWSNASASRISNTYDVFYLSVWNTTNPNIALAATVGSPSYFLGNVGIGTTTPAGKLEINDGNGTGPIAYFGANGITNGKGLYFSRPVSNTNPGNIQGTLYAVGATDISLQAEGGNVGIGTSSPSNLLTVGSSSKRGTLNVIGSATDAPAFSISDSRTAGHQYTFYNGVSGTGNLDIFDQTTNAYRFTINSSGNIGIGTTSPGSYMLAVNGNVHARQVNVDVTGWGDYVFKSNYVLAPLSMVKAYVDQYHHLPEIPSEQQIAKDGLNLGEMNKLLVKKVEELTLYLIKKDQQIKAQNERIDRLEETQKRILKKLK